MSSSFKEEEDDEEEYAVKVVDTVLAVMALRGWRESRRFGSERRFPDRILFEAEAGVVAEVLFVHDPRERLLEVAAHDALAEELAARQDTPALCVVVVGRVKPEAGRPAVQPCGLYGCQTLRRAERTGATTVHVRAASRRSWKEKATSGVYERNARWTSPVTLELLPAAYFFAMELDAGAQPYVAADVSDVLGRLGLRSRAQLPRVLPDDVVVVVLGAKFGDVVVYPPDDVCPSFTARLVAASAVSVQPLFPEAAS